MAEFAPAYQLERKHEGYYVNNPSDKGGETYAGVARKIYPAWNGFPVLDAYKAKLGRALKTNEQVPGMEPYVQAFYQNLWNVNRFGEIKNQDLANIIYDWFVNSGYIAFSTKPKETYGLDEILVEKFKQLVPIDGRLDTATIVAVNKVDSTALYNEIKNARIAFYNYLATKDPSQSVFLKGWLSRINSFPTLAKAGIGAGTLLVLAGLFFLGYKILNHE